MLPFRSAGWLIGMALLSLTTATVQAQSIQTYGDKDMLGTGTYSSDPTAGATLYGLSPGTVTDATNYYAHGYPFSPSAGDYVGTDQIYVGSVQTANHDGYSFYSGRLNSPLVITLNYGALLPAGQSLRTLTLGIAADDFQDSVFGQPYTATLNGVAATALTTHLNALNETGPLVHFFAVGVDPTLLTSNNTLTLSINEGGDGGDGFAVDFLTVGVTTNTATPEPGALALLVGLGASGAGFLVRRRRNARKAV